MNRIWQRVIVLLLVGVGVAFSIWTHYKSHREMDPTTSGSELRIGERMPVPSVNSGARMKLVLALSADCPACNEELLFYKELVEQARSHAIPVTALLHQRGGGISWLDEQGVKVDYSQLTNLKGLGINQVPTLLLLDDNLRVTDMLVGKLSPRAQSLVLRRLAGLVGPEQLAAARTETSIPARLTEEELQNLSRIRSHRVLDLRERRLFSAKHRPGAVNIPYDELESRAAIELNRSEVWVLDCTSIPHVVCELSARTLYKLDFYDVTMLLRNGMTP